MQAMLAAVKQVAATTQAHQEAADRQAVEIARLGVLIGGAPIALKAILELVQAGRNETAEMAGRLDALSMQLDAINSRLQGCKNPPDRLA